MKRIFPDFTYGAGPRQGCWWDETIAAPDWPELRGEAPPEVTTSFGAGRSGFDVFQYEIRLPIELTGGDWLRDALNPRMR